MKNWSHFYILYFFFSFPSENLFAMLELSKLDLAFLTREMHKVISNELSFFFWTMYFIWTNNECEENIWGKNSTLYTSKKVAEPLLYQNHIYLVRRMRRKKNELWKRSPSQPVSFWCCSRLPKWNGTKYIKHGYL